MDFELVKHMAFFNFLKPIVFYVYGCFAGMYVCAPQASGASGKGVCSSWKPTLPSSQSAIDKLIKMQEYMQGIKQPLKLQSSLGERVTVPWACPRHGAVLGLVWTEPESITMSYTYLGTVRVELAHWETTTYRIYILRVWEEWGCWSVLCPMPTLQH